MTSVTELSQCVRVLVTNAHGKAIALKFRRTPLGAHLDALVCAHDFSVPKEDLRFWDRLHGREPFDRDRTLLIDDSLAVLRSAHRYGIAHLLSIRQPDSRQDERAISEFPAIRRFSEVMPQST